MKTCTKCKKELSSTEFHKNNTKKDKLSNVCKSCSNIATREWQAKNREHHNKQQREQKVNRNKRGLCCHCLNKKLPTSTMCEKHWYEGVSRSHFGTTKFGTHLKEKAESQNYRCFYTDEILLPAVNMSLDHIISNHDDPSKKEDLENVQWVTKDINLIKNKLSHQPFINLCKYIYEKFRTTI